MGAAIAHRISIIITNPFGRAITQAISLHLIHIQTMGIIRAVGLTRFNYYRLLCCSANTMSHRMTCIHKQRNLRRCHGDIVGNIIYGQCSHTCTNRIQNTVLINQYRRIRLGAAYLIRGYLLIGDLYSFYGNIQQL